MKDFSRIEKDVISIETKFLNQLFDDNKISYLTLFNYYCNEWEKFCNYCQGKKLKHTTPNKDYFKIKYYPVEKY